MGDKALPGSKFYQQGDVTIKIEEGVDVEDIDMDTWDMTVAATRTPYMLMALKRRTPTRRPSEEGCRERCSTRGA